MSNSRLSPSQTSWPPSPPGGDGMLSVKARAASINHWLCSWGTFAKQSSDCNLASPATIQGLETGPAEPTWPFRLQGRIISFWACKGEDQTFNHHEFNKVLPTGGWWGRFSCPLPALGTWGSSCFPVLFPPLSMQTRKPREQVCE